MKFRTKAMVLVAAVLITFFGFNLLASPGMISLLVGGKEIQYKALSKSPVKLDVNYTVIVIG